MPALASNTRTFFKQTTAPTGWTKLTENDDYTVRVVTGTGGSIAGSLNFSTTMVDSTIEGTLSSISSTMTAVIADLPAHVHTLQMYTSTGTTGIGSAPLTGAGYNSLSVGGTTGPGGNNQSHTHGYNVTLENNIVSQPIYFAVKYVDFILAYKN